MKNLFQRHILRGKEPVVETDLAAFTKWMNGPERFLAETKFSDGKRLSTVFLGLDHGDGVGKPLFFETMLFPSDENFSGEEFEERYATYDEAIVRHREITLEREKNGVSVVSHKHGGIDCPICQLMK